MKRLKNLYLVVSLLLTSVAVHAQEHEPTPALGAHLAQAHVAGQVVELVTVGNVGHPAVEPVTPAVVAAPDRGVGESAAALGVRAGVDVVLAVVTIGSTGHI